MNTQPTLHVVTGLCGSGKSTLLQTKFQPHMIVFDSIMKNSRNNSPHYRDCRHREAIHKTLLALQPIALSDIRFLHLDFRREFLEEISELIHPDNIRWHCFIPHLEACRNNLYHRALKSPETTPPHLEETNRQFFLSCSLPNSAILYHTHIVPYPSD
ncbi:MAG: hypothetical protein HC904_08940 [Blastochloris sp.]|nr:hypothetical protein [Blastochloris sp.]